MSKDKIYDTNKQINPFAKLKIQTKPRPADFQTIEVQINTDIVDKWTEAEFKELISINAILLDTLKLTLDELKLYNRFLLLQRVKSVNGDCPLWRKLKVLYITAPIQTAIAMIGKVDVFDEGLLFVPVMDLDINEDFQKIQDISFKLSRFKDVIIMRDDAMPRGTDGDPHVMQMANFAGVIRSRIKESDPLSSYIAAFLDLKLVEEEKWRMMYRISYDDIGYITSCILSDLNLLSVREEAIKWVR